MCTGELFGFGLWWLFPILMIVFCLVMMRGCLGGGRDHRYSRGDPDREESALEILQKQFVRGEIDEREYEAKKKSLT